MGRGGGGVYSRFLHHSEGPGASLRRSPREPPTNAPSTGEQKLQPLSLPPKFQQASSLSQAPPRKEEIGDGEAGLEAAHG